MPKCSVFGSLPVFVSLALSSSILMGVVSASQVEPLNVAHRGASAVSPENTLDAYREAVKMGANGAECDVRITADGVLILAHDATTRRTMGGGEQQLHQLTYAAVQKLDAGAWKNPRFSGEKVPTLDEYLACLQKTDCAPVVEIKVEGIEKLVLEAIRQRKMLEVTTVIAFSPTVVQAVRKQEPRIKVAFLYSEKIQGTPEANAPRLAALLLEKCRTLDISILDLNHGLLSPQLIQTLHESGVSVWCWTVNNPARMRVLLDWGVDSITTDHPDILTKVLAERASMPANTR